MSVNLNNILKPKSKEDIINYLNNLSQEEKNQKLIDASRQGQLYLVKLLIDANANINAINKYGNTPLIIASINNKLNIVKFLLKCNVDINTKNCHGHTAIMYAHIFLNNNSKIINLLRKNDTIKSI